MSSPLIHRFESFDDADAARGRLVSAGLPPEALELRVLADEAGPVEGNFVAGNGRFEEGDPTRATEQRAADAPPYAANFGTTVERGLYLLIVDLDDPSRREQATTLLAAGPGTALGDAASGELAF